jgi:ABC-type branched-subunit amino acid transport system substrate-binding protein
VRFLALALLLVGLVGCPGRHTRRTMTPAIPHTGNADARARFEKAQAKFLRDGQSTEEFERIVQDFPQDPIVPWAQLYAGITAVNDRKFDLAAQKLKEVIDADANPQLGQRAELFLGIAKNYLGDAAGALPLLARGEKVTETDGERTEWLAAVAYATASAGERPITALRFFDQLYGRVTPAERALIAARCEELVAATDPNALRKAFDEIDDKKGPAMAAVATRLAVLAEQSGNAKEAAQMRDLATSARAAVGLGKTISAGAIATTSNGTPGLIGAVVPLGGKANQPAEQTVAGLGLASGVAGTGGAAAVEVRAAADDAASAVAVEDLGKHDVVAIVGPMDAAAVDKAAERAEALKVPLLSLTGRPEGRYSGRFIFHMRHSAEARARVLARTAIAKGVKTFAVLRPDNNYGKSVAGEFADEVQKQGGSIAITIVYSPDDKTFTAYPSKLGSKWDGLFIPDNAERLANVVPYVTAAKLIPQPIGTKRVAVGRPIVLLSTAEGLTGSYIAQAGRHSIGALLAPGYYPDDQDPTNKAFIDKFIQAYGRAPGINEAYAYDAAQAVAAAGGRGALVGLLGAGTLTGVTGPLQFDANHRRSDPGVLYSVVEENGGVYSIRVAK